MMQQPLRDDSREIGCPLCHSVSALWKWDWNTRLQCRTDEMKQDYVSLASEEAYYKTSDTFYLCPHCGRWVAGYLLQRQ